MAKTTSRLPTAFFAADTCSLLLLRFEATPTVTMPATTVHIPRYWYPTGLRFKINADSRPTKTTTEPFNNRNVEDVVYRSPMPERVVAPTSHMAGTKHSRPAFKETPCSAALLRPASYGSTGEATRITSSSSSPNNSFWVPDPDPYRPAAAPPPRRRRHQVFATKAARHMASPMNMTNVLRPTAPRTRPEQSRRKSTRSGCKP
jgi:hypothetical protein